MKIFITAISSFIGGNLARRLVEENHRVSGSVRQLNDKSNELLPNSNLTEFSLGQELDYSHLQGQDLIIHCAHDFSSSYKKSYEINVQGTKAIFNAANLAGIKQQIFISSYSAQPQANSVYGKIKYELEQYF